MQCSIGSRTLRSASDLHTTLAAAWKIGEYIVDEFCFQLHHYGNRTHISLVELNHQQPSLCFPKYGACENRIFSVPKNTSNKGTFRHIRQFVLLSQSHHRISSRNEQGINCQRAVGFLYKSVINRFSYIVNQIKRPRIFFSWAVLR